MDSQTDPARPGYWEMFFAGEDNQCNIDHTTHRVWVSLYKYETSTKCPFCHKAWIGVYYLYQCRSHITYISVIVICDKAVLLPSATVKV